MLWLAISKVQSLRINILLVWQLFVYWILLLCFVMPAYCLCLTQNNTTPHVQWTWNNQRRFPVQYVKKKQRHLTDSRFHSVPIDLVFLLFSSVFSAGFDSERNLRCGFAQRHLTISWNWHRSSVTGIVCYLIYNTVEQYITEQSDEKERQCPLCSFCWCQYRRRSF